ncbi:DNA ligase 1-like isoform X1 [Chiloscyllium plagiosum]|uniref:DNA ligase 1-like isoform X1 n=1 Tax=Chiloscyllium plagiosum TaxID=36176 RepID=UPI001CB7AD69|nr:DNA ligase 1-like isoform X1 [Chiloscyllium plagiosum]
MPRSLKSLIIMHPFGAIILFSLFLTLWFVLMPLNPQREVSQLKQQNTQLRESHKKLEVKMTALYDDLKKTQEEKEKEVREVSQLKQQNTQLRESHKKLEVKMTALYDDLKKTQEEKEKEVREVSQLKQQNTQLQESHKKLEVKMTALYDDLKKTQEEKEKEVARQHENILELEKRMKELEQLNHNLTIKQQQLDDEIKKCQEQSDRCHREEELMNNKLKAAGEELRQCRLDRDGCQKLHGQASRVHGIHTGLIALSIAFFNLLC